MEYILIFITAIFVNNIVLSQFLGICPFLGVSKKVETAMGMGAAVAFVLTLATIVTYIIQKFVLDPFGLAYLHSRNCGIGTNGRNHPKKSIACPLSGIGRISSADYHQLLHFGCSYFGHSERLRFIDGSHLCLLYGIRLCSCLDSLCRYPRTA